MKVHGYEKAGMKVHGYETSSIQKYDYYTIHSANQDKIAEEDFQTFTGQNSTSGSAPLLFPWLKEMAIWKNHPAVILPLCLDSLNSISKNTENIDKIVGEKAKTIEDKKQQSG